MTRTKEELKAQFLELTREYYKVIIASYKLNINKIKRPAKLHIICRREEGFSLNKIGDYI